MPIYEFFCPQTNKIYSFYARNLSFAGKVPRCPENAKYRMEKMVSSFAVTGKAKEEPASGGPDSPADDPRFERVMAEMERDVAGMDEENPDPRQLAHMMRKMSSLTGEKIPETMEEMIRRMEAGEDPEKLEEEYGDELGDFDPMGGGGGEEGQSAEAVAERKRRRPARVQRDPTLYEMADYVG